MPRTSPGLQIFSWFLAAAALAASILGVPLSARADAPSVPWPQTVSDLPAESGIRFGMLANGMRFAILRNATPTGQAAIRFRIGSGSLEEDDRQQGLAHFLEHMAFKGSTHVAEGEMIRILQRKGLAFGPDTNAFTSYGQTVYALDLPEVDADTVSTGLMLMRETASELKLDPRAFDDERGVILSEERLRDTPQYRGSIGLLNILLAGQRVPMRPPIGKTDIISNASVDLVKDYYRDNYRPDRATLMVVGDIDPAAIETQIRQRFDDWKPAGPAKAEPDLGVREAQGPGANVVTVPGGPTRVQIVWTHAYDASPDSFAKRRAQMIEDIGLSVLKRRVAAMARRADAPFLSAAVASQDLYASARIALVGADSDPDKWQTALAAIDREQRRLAMFGAEQAEIDREILEYRASLEASAGGAATRTSTDLASTLAQSIDEDKVFTSPAEELSLLQRMTQGLTAQEVTQALQRVFAGDGPRVVLQTSKAPDGGADAVAKAYAESRATAVTAPASATAAVWPYTNFGVPGTVSERRSADDLGVTMVRFGNGVRLTVKPTKLRADEVLVRVDVGQGRLGLPHDHPLATWTEQAVELSGVKAIDYEGMQKALTANVASIGFSIEDSSFKFEGRTRPADLAVQLQVFTAYASDPAYRPEVFNRLRQSYLNNLAQYEATPGGIVSRDFLGLVHSGDPRWTFPDRAQLLATTPKDFQALFEPGLTRGAIEVTVVGDVSVDEAIRLTANTFGALPARPDNPKILAQDIRFPEPTAQPVRLTHTGRVDNASAVAAVPIGDMLSDFPRAFAANLAGEIFENRLIDQFRIAEGATYSPQGEVSLAKSIPGYGYAYTYVETTPAKVERFYALVDKIATDMASTEVSADELGRAREPVLETSKHQREGNDYWLQNLRGCQTDPRRLDLIRQTVSGYENVTPQDIRKIAATYFKPEKFWKMEVLPAAGTAVR